jgi:curved DNA-binding protein CbpA
MDESAVRRILCEMLGVHESATEEEIHQGYSEQAKKWHPDRVQHNPELAAIAEKKLKEINQAYDCLKSRAEFDKHGAKLANKTQPSMASQHNPNKDPGGTSATRSQKSGSTSQPHSTGAGKTSKSQDEKTASSKTTRQTDPDTNGSKQNKDESGAKPRQPGPSESAANRQSEKAQADSFGQTAQSWHAGFAPGERATSKPVNPYEINELRKLGTKVAIWMTLIFLILAYIEDKMHNHKQLNGYVPSFPNTSHYPPYDISPSSAVPAPQPQSRPAAPANDSAAPPPGETVPQIRY